MESLTKKSLLYLNILYLIWSTLDYYSNIFGIDVGGYPEDLSAKIEEREGKIFIVFTMGFLGEKKDLYTFEDMKKIIQEYLVINILPDNQMLKPYKGGEGIYDRVVPLYIDEIIEKQDVIEISVIWIDNALAFQYIQNKMENERKIL